MRKRNQHAHNSIRRSRNTGDAPNSDFAKIAQPQDFACVQKGLGGCFPQQAKNERFPVSVNRSFLACVATQTQLADLDRISKRPCGLLCSVDFSVIIPFLSPLNHFSLTFRLPAFSLTPPFVTRFSPFDYSFSYLKIIVGYFDSKNCTQCFVY